MCNEVVLSHPLHGWVVIGLVCAYSHQGGLCRNCGCLMKVRRSIINTPVLLTGLVRFSSLQ